MKEINITYYAMLHEIVGCSEERLQTTAETLGGLFAELRSRHQLSLSEDQVFVAVNDVYANMTDSFATGDHVVFIPPIAGG